MKNIVGHAKNEVLEIIIGVLFNIIGGVFIGSVYVNPLDFLLWISAVAFTTVGIVFEVRVVAKHTHELRKMNKELESARKENIETIGKMQEQQALIDSASKELKNTIESTQQLKTDLQEMEKKTFSTFSISSGRPLEDDIDRLHNRLQVVEEKLGISSFFQRKSGRR